MSVPPAAAFPGEIGRVAPMTGVDVLRFDLDADGIDPAWARARVTAAEAARCDRFVTDELQRRGLNTRALVRAVLGAWTGNEPLALVFEAGPNDKPRLAQGPDGRAFNISHSGARLLIALSSRGEIGVDVELPGGSRDMALIARREFNAKEIAALEGLKADAYERAFLRLWTLKEACLKAVGSGIAQGMRDVELAPEALSSIEASSWSPERVELEGAALDVCDISDADDIACVATTTPST